MQSQDQVPAELTEAEWEQLLEVFAASSYHSTIEKLKKTNNVAQKARDIFIPSQVNYGHDPINAYLLKRESPFRLGRIGSWSGRQNRADRLLAIVRFASKE